MKPTVVGIAIITRIVAEADIHAREQSKKRLRTRGATGVATPHLEFWWEENRRLPVARPRAWGANSTEHGPGRPEPNPRRQQSKRLVQANSK